MKITDDGLNISLYDDLLMRIIRRELLRNHVKLSRENNYKFHSSYLKYQNINLIESEEVTLLKANSHKIIQAPVIITEKIKAQYNYRDYYFYHPANNLSLPTIKYIIVWSKFNKLRYFEKGKYTKALIFKAINDCRNEYGCEVSVKFVCDLWKYHWIFGRRICTIALAQAWGIETDEQFVKLSSNEQFIGERFDEVDNYIQYLKEKSKSIDEWIWGLYLVAPQILFIYKLSKNSKNDEVQKINRIVDEIIADRGDFSISLDLFSLTDRFVKARKYNSFEEVNLEELRKKLEFECLCRTHIPKYWADEVLFLLKDKRYSELEKLNHFDTTLKVAIDCTELGLNVNDW